jgi:uncharacterized protein YlxW (UPF0749 family)
VVTKVKKSREELEELNKNLEKQVEQLGAEVKTLEQQLAYQEPILRGNIYADVVKKLREFKKRPHNAEKMTLKQAMDIVCSEARSWGKEVE